MTLKFCSFSSGSSGNCYLIKNDSIALLVDAGISGKRIMEGLKETGTDKEKVRGLFLTHEHTDHIKSVRVLGKKLPMMNVYATSGTWRGVESSVDHQLCDERCFVLSSDSSVRAENIEIRAFALSHDAAEPVGYSFISEGKKISVVTDTGCITEEIFSEIRGADLLVIEANHEVRVLEMGRYPYYLKRRILGDQGHLSNEHAADCIARLALDHPRHRKVLLAHLSHENNTPDLAYMTVSNMLEERGIRQDRNLDIEVIFRDTVSRIYEL